MQKMDDLLKKYPLPERMKEPLPADGFGLGQALSNLEKTLYLAMMVVQDQQEEEQKKQKNSNPSKDGNQDRID